MPQVIDRLYRPTHNISYVNILECVFISDFNSIFALPHSVRILHCD